MLPLQGSSGTTVLAPVAPGAPRVQKIAQGTAITLTAAEEAAVVEEYKQQRKRDKKGGGAAKPGVKPEDVAAARAAASAAVSTLPSQGSSPPKSTGPVVGSAPRVAPPAGSASPRSLAAHAASQAAAAALSGLVLSLDSSGSDTCSAQAAADAEDLGGGSDAPPGESTTHDPHPPPSEPLFLVDALSALRSSLVQEGVQAPARNPYGGGRTLKQWASFPPSKSEVAPHEAPTRAQRTVGPPPGFGGPSQRPSLFQRGPPPPGFGGHVMQAAPVGGLPGSTLAAADCRPAGSREMGAAVPPYSSPFAGIR